VVQTASGYSDPLDGPATDFGNRNGELQRQRFDATSDQFRRRRPGTPAGTSTITVTASSGGSSSGVPITLTVTR
jgi:hypothetical protein